MINSNTPQAHSVVTGTTTESTIYLKKSELPKNVSSFRNDAGYISTTSLTDWLKKHSYISKNEIKDLINDANVNVIDSINHTYDDNAISNFDKALTNVKGEITEIKDLLRKLGSDKGFITLDKEMSFASRTELSNINDSIQGIRKSMENLTLKFVTKNDLSSNGYATEKWVYEQGFVKDLPDFSKYALKTDIKKIPDLSGFALKSDIPDVPQKISELINDKNYITYSQISNYYNKPEIDRKIDNIRNLITGISLDEYVNESWVKDWVNGQGFLKTHQSLKDYYNKSEIDTKLKSIKSTITNPSLNGFATKEWVEEQGFITSVTMPDLSNLATKSDLTSITKGYAKESWVKNQNYLTKHQDLTGYATEKWVIDQRYLTEHQDLSDYAKTSWITSQGYINTSKLNTSLAPYAKKTEVYDRSTIDNKFKPYLTKEDAEATYPTKKDVNSTYPTKKDVAREYLKIEDYRGLKDATIISDTYKNKPYEDFQKDIELLANGFYFVKSNDGTNTNSIVILKNHQVISLMKDGMSALVWVEED